MTFSICPECRCLTLATVNVMADGKWVYRACRACAYKDRIHYDEESRLIGEPDVQFKSPPKQPDKDQRRLW